MNIEKKVAEAGYQLPEVKGSSGQFLPGKSVGNLLFVSGSTPLKDGKPLFQGSVGDQVTLEQARESARQAVVCELGKIRTVLGDLDRVKEIVKVNGYIAAGPGFTAQSEVLNAASDLLAEIFGEAGKHARTAVAVSSLPGNAPLASEMTVSFA